MHVAIVAHLLVIVSSSLSQEDFLESAQHEGYVLSRTPLGTSIFSVSRVGRQEPVISHSASEQKPSRAPLFFSAGGASGGLLGNGLFGGAPARTILAVPTSGSLTAAPVNCCPCSAPTVYAPASGAIVAAPGTVGFTQFAPSVSGQLIALPFLNKANSPTQLRPQQPATMDAQVTAEAVEANKQSRRLARTHRANG